MEIGSDGSELITPVSSGTSQHYDLTGFNGDLYFFADDGVVGVELHKYDPDANVASLVEDVNVGSGSSFAKTGSGPVEVNNSLYFSATDGKNGYQIYKLEVDGSDSETLARVTAFDGGTTPSQRGLFEFNGDLYFTGFDAADGWELRKIDGETGSVDSFDFLVGAKSDSNAQVIGEVNGQLVVKAWMDSDSDGVGDRWAMLVSNGEPNSVADFAIVDHETPEGTYAFTPGSGLYVYEGDQLLF